MINFSFNYGFLCVVQLCLVTQASIDWDILIFTQHWPATVCKEWKEQAVGHTCRLKLTDSWTVHGIWPTKLGTKGPQFCNNSLTFHPDQLKELEIDLLSYWPNIYNGTSEYSLWKHEWLKHGTCASVLESLNSEVKYFSSGLHWLQMYSMNNVLSRAGINPDVKGYSLQQLWDAVKGNLGKNVDIQCVFDKETKHWYLFEIRICLDKTFKLVDCDGIKMHEDKLNPIISNCPASKEIIYPKYALTSVDHDIGSVKPASEKMLLEVLKTVQLVQWITF